MKGIILAGGTGSRLWPITEVVSKQLLPVYDKPLIYYPLSTLMLSGIRDILVITTPSDLAIFTELLGDGNHLGIKISYATQPKPLGLAEAFLIGKNFIEKEPVVLILGDNLFYGSGITDALSSAIKEGGCSIFSYQVSNPQDYGVLTLDSDGTPTEIVEKPLNPSSNLAITGLYVFDNNISEIAKSITPSSRGELEITSAINFYLQTGNLKVWKLSRGIAWLDTGTPGSLHDAASFVKVIEERTGQKIACIEEISWRNGWISDSDLLQLADVYGKSQYGKYLQDLVPR